MQHVGQRFIKEKGWFYYVCKRGFVCRFNIKKPGIKQKLSSDSINKEKGYLYYITKAGFVGRKRLKR